MMDIKIDKKFIEGVFDLNRRLEELSGQEISARENNDRWKKNLINDIDKLETKIRRIEISKPGREFVLKSLEELKIKIKNGPGFTLKFLNQVRQVRHEVSGTSKDDTRITIPKATPDPPKW